MEEIRGMIIKKEDLERGIPKHFMRMIYGQKARKTYVQYPLSNGDIFCVHPKTDQLLREGYTFNKNNPWKKKALNDAIEWFYYNVFDENFHELAKTLKEVYKHSDYNETRMREWCRIFKKKKEDREIEGIIRKLSKKGLLPKLKEAIEKREKGYPLVTEELGDEGTEKIVKETKWDNRKKMAEKIDKEFPKKLSERTKKIFEREQKKLRRRAEEYNLDDQE